jgi:serine/threonine protein kinase/Tfp pilus assembly protein PilF
VALKEIVPRRADDAECRSRFLFEAAITGRLEHPGVVPVYGLSHHADGRPYYTMRFIKGQTLRQALRGFHGKAEESKPGSQRKEETLRFHSLEFRQLLSRFVYVCNTIAFCHSRGVIHRDIKPDNIMLGEYGETLVVDWGLAKATISQFPKDTTPTHDQHLSLTKGADADGQERGVAPPSTQERNQTEAGAIIGTPGCMSPEQAIGNHNQVGPAADIFSLGATLYSILIGQAPYPQENVQEALGHAVLGKFVPPRRIKASVPAPLEAICLRAMAWQPEQRYATALELAEDIEHWLGDQPIRAWREPWALRAVRWTRKHRSLVSGAAAALVVAALAGILSLMWFQNERVRRANILFHYEDAVRSALAQAEAPRKGLAAALNAPGGIFTLLDDSNRWNAETRSSQTALDHAWELLAETNMELDSTLRQRAQGMQTWLKRHEADRELALHLDDIRQRRTRLIKGKIDHAKAARDYPLAFARAGFGDMPQDPQAAAAKIASSTIREVLVAGLDDWALAARAVGDDDLHARLLEIARLAAPHSQLGDRVRQPASRLNRKTLTELVDQHLSDLLSPHLSQLVGHLLNDDPRLREHWLRLAHDRHPADFWLNVQVGEVLATSNPAEAIEFYRAALAARANSSAVYFNLGEVYLAQKQWGRAADVFEKAVAYDPSFVEALNSLGLARHGLKQLNLAEEAIAKAVARDPQNAAYHVNLGKVFNDQQQYDKAIETFQHAIELEPLSPLAHHHLGDAYRGTKQLRLAGDAYLRALQIDDKSYLSYLWLGQTYMDLKEYWLAQTACEKAVELQPKAWEARYKLAYALGRRGFFAASYDMFTDILKGIPLNHGLRPNVVYVLDNVKKMDDLDKDVAAVLEGKKTVSTAELKEMAEFCWDSKLCYATAARLYQLAFADFPYPDEEVYRNYFHAACAAVQAGTCRGKDARLITEDEKAEMRYQGLDWLKAALKAHVRIAATNQHAQLEEFEQRLVRLLQHPILTHVREHMEASQLSEQEQKGWKQMWADVRAHLAEIRTRLAAPSSDGGN